MRDEFFLFFYYASIRSLPLSAPLRYSFFGIGGAICKFVAHYNACNITLGGSDTREVGTNREHTHMSDLSYNLLFFQNNEGICIQ